MAASLTPSNSDLSVQLLDKIFGAGWQSFGGNPSGFFQTILGIFDSALFAVVAVIGVYSLMMGITEAAHDGVPLGKRYSKWMPFRIVAAGAFLAPVSNGISIVQAVFLWIAGMGVGLADQVWAAGTQYLVQSGPAVVYSMDTGTELAKNALHSLVCQAWVNNNYYYVAQGKQTDMNGNPLSPPPSNWITENSTSGTFTITNPQSTGYGSYFGASPGGSVTTNVTEGVSFDGSTGTGIPPQACGAFTYGYNSSTPGSSLMSSAQANALKQMLSTLAPLANAIVGTPTASGTPASGAPTLPDPSPLFNAVNAYQNAVAKAAASVASQGSNATALNQWQATAQQAGWLSAGSFYYSFSHQNQKLSALVSKKWSYQGVAVDAFANIPGNGTFSLKNTLSSVDGYTKILEQAGNFAGNPPTPAQMATASGTVSTGSSMWAKFLNLISSPFTGLVTSYATMTTENGDPLLTMQSYGNTVIDTAEAIAVATTAAAAATGAVKNGTKGLSHIPTIGGVIGAVGGAFSGASSAALKSVLPLIYAVIFSLIVFGAGLAYISPMLPFIFFNWGVLIWTLILLEGLIAIPLWGIAHANPEGEGFISAEAKAGYLKVLDVLIRPSLLVLGFFMVFELSDALMFLINNGFGAMVAGITAGSLTGIVGMLSLLLGVNILMIGGMSKLFHFSFVSLPGQVLSWVGAHASHGDLSSFPPDDKSASSGMSSGGKTLASAAGGGAVGMAVGAETAPQSGASRGPGRERGITESGGMKPKSADGGGNLNDAAQSQE
ncbi:MAG: DotA/TraY family protein [Nitrospirota bacterium]|nr:DotA/TraY family protein [Nitrospirota bacterium]